MSTRFKEHYMKKLIAAVMMMFVVVAVAPVHAENWVKLRKNGNSTCFYDPYSVTWSAFEVDGIASFRIKLVLDVPHVPADYSIVKTQIDCFKRKTKVLKYFVYSSATDGLLDSWVPTAAESEWEALVPGSNADVIAGRICPSR